MSKESAEGASRWTDAALAAALFSVDPVGTAGIIIRASPGPVRERWLTLVRELMPRFEPMRRLPLHVSDGRLLGGLDLAATLQAGRPVAERGLLAEADGGVVIAAMAERLAAATAARLAAVLDVGEVALERDGLALRSTARIGLIALDEGLAADERVPLVLLDRLAFYLDLGDVGVRDTLDVAHRLDQVVSARAMLATVRASEEIIQGLCGAAFALGIASIRASLLALRAARAAAALAGRLEVTQADAAVAGRLVFASRATTAPMPEPPSESDAAEAAPEEKGADASRNEEPLADEAPSADRSLGDVVVAAARAAIPADLLAQLRLGERMRPRAPSAGKVGAQQSLAQRGRPVGTRRGELRAGARLNVIETLRAAAPWQPLRRRESGVIEPAGRGDARIAVRREDFRVTRFKQRSETTTIFVVDASGSAALHRLAETKGAVELLLADCYVRRDRVAVLAFRRSGAELLLPPTRSLVRAKRSLAGLPGGGGTPLAAGIDAALALADAVRRKGHTPIVILLTDGRANVARDGRGGRAQAEVEALAAARALRVAGVTSLLVDTSQHSQPLAQRLAAEMSALYLPLPHADAAALSGAVRTMGLSQLRSESRPFG